VIDETLVYPALLKRWLLDFSADFSVENSSSKNTRLYTFIQ